MSDFQIAVIIARIDRGTFAFTFAFLVLLTHLMVLRGRRVIAERLEAEARERHTEPEPSAPIGLGHFMWPMAFALVLSLLVAGIVGNWNLISQQFQNDTIFRAIWQKIAGG